MKLIASLVAALSLTVVSSACGKKAEPTPAPAPTTAPATTPAPETKPAEAADATAPAAEEVAAPTAEADVAPAAEEVAAEEPAEVKPFIKVTVPHNDEKPPVTAEFTGFKVIEAHVDLSKPETAKAVIEVDLTSFSSGIPDRDSHVKSPDFLDVATSPKATITVAGIKAGAVADTYDATATLELRGAKKDVPVTFKVVEKKADGTLVIEGESKGVARADFNMTKTPAEVNVGANFDVALRLEIAETAAPVEPMAGTPDEIVGKMVATQEALIGLIEPNKANPDAAAEAIEKYVAEHKDELAAMTAALNKMAPDQIEAALKGAEAKLKPIAERGMKLMQENPGLEKSERFMKAMQSLSGGGK